VKSRAPLGNESVSETARGIGFGFEGDRERLNLIVDTAPIAVVAIDPFGRIATAANSASSI
jgi:hypothetical protein